MSKKIIAYRLQPVYEPSFDSISTACLMQCAATGEVLSGMGGGGLFLAPHVVEGLLAKKPATPEEGAQ